MKRSGTKDERASGGSADARRESGYFSFVVQKHAATRLHYDFRLELDGVLKSWAIPKGPSLDPMVKRLAMMVEDHPYEYRDFEGSIPKGNYGAGEVLIWDQGSYRSASTEDREEGETALRKGLEKGDLKFILYGQKLRGEFALVRIKSADDNSWLLIKKQDEFASAEDITRDNRSVVSDRILEDRNRSELSAGKEAPRKAPPEAPVETALQGPAGREYQKEPAEPVLTPALPLKGRGRPTRAAPAEVPAAAPTPTEFSPPQRDAVAAPRAPMPHRVKPMLAATLDEPFDSPDWLFEIKLDGYRAVAEIADSSVLLYSRNNLSFNQKFRIIVEALQAVSREAVIDGEVVILDEKGRASFQLLQNYERTGKGNLAYFAFDLLYLDGRDLTELPLEQRKELLKSVLPRHPQIKFSDHIVELGKALFQLAKENDLEGIIAKKRQSRYYSGRRTKEWLKIKIKLQQEAVICGFTEPRGSRRHLGALVLGVFEKEELVYIGLCGGGFSEESLNEVMELLEPIVQQESPFGGRRIPGLQATWVHPLHVCEVTFSEWTDEGVMRQPVFLGLRSDKDARAVVRERVEVAVQEVLQGEPRPPEEEKPGRLAGKKDVQLEINGRTLKLTNLDKIFWPKEGYTKGDVIEYYRRVAPLMVPHLKGRPQSLYRTPEGLGKPGFFQKDVGDLPPEWTITTRIYSKSNEKYINYFVCQDEAALVYLANLGCIEINPWLSRLQSLDYPDFLVIDLDPEDIAFEKVIDTALAVREVLEEAGATGYPKTSGATGIHIYVPLAARYDYETAGNFARLLATLVHNRVPDFTSIVRDPSKRQQRVYLDFLQNRAGQTIAAPYSLRARPGAPVSTPLKWEEVKPGLSPSHFTIESVHRRIERFGDLFAGALGEGVDIAECIAKLESAR